MGRSRARRRVQLTVENFGHHGVRDFEQVLVGRSAARSVHGVDRSTSLCGVASKPWRDTPCRGGGARSALSGRFPKRRTKHDVTGWRPSVCLGRRSEKRGQP
jgi:hypothetical protein